MEVSTPIVSIIVPAYNAELYIHEAIRSVLNQTYQDWELLIIDDGSTDSTAARVNSFSDDRIIFTQQENAGVSSARNAGLDRAQGKYITFLDADDILPSQSIELRVDYLDMHPTVDLVDGHICIKDSHMENTTRIYEPYYHGQLLSRLIGLDSKVFFNVCYMFKKALLGNARFNEMMTHAEDLLFYMELASKEQIVYGYLKDEIYWYRSGHTSTMTNMQGLEDGYISLISQIEKLPNISTLQKLIFRFKIAKIMALSWLSQKKYMKAILSIKFIGFS